MQKITRADIPRLSDTVDFLGYTNLLVSGCSFTSVNFGDLNFYLDILKKNYTDIRSDAVWPDVNNGHDWDSLPDEIKLECENHGCNWRTLTYITWPIYVRDLLGFTTVYDCSFPGAGNNHIHDSVVYALESTPALTKDNTLVVVMWSGIDRDDFIVDQSWVKGKAYNYADDVCLGLTGGMVGDTNLQCSVNNVKKIKSDKSRAIENYINVVGLENYLSNNGFNFVFSNFSTDIRERQINIESQLPASLREKWVSLVNNIPSLGDYSTSTIDGSHPTSDHSWSWTKNILVPEVLRNTKGGKL